MKAFISYSHIDERYVQRLHTHLSQMKRDGLISAWYDREISVGDNIDREIFETLNDSNVFIAIVSPDFLASRYCYEEEMISAIDMHENERIRIIPLIAEPCDWLNSPLQIFRATPSDGKPISEWSNPNNAFLEVVTDLRKLASDTKRSVADAEVKKRQSEKMSATFRTKHDFDKIDKIKFKEEAFFEIAEKLESWCAEANRVDGIKALFERISTNRFFVTLVNRNKSNATAERTVYISEEDSFFGGINLLHQRSTSSSSSNGGFAIEADDFQLFLKPLFSAYSPASEILSATDVAHTIWNEMMHSVGIEYAD